jgi:hypothetical protein
LKGDGDFMISSTYRVQNWWVRMQLWQTYNADWILREINLLNL